MENNIITKNYDTNNIKNAKLRQATNNINKIGTSMRQNYFKIAAIIAKVDAEKAFEEDGFKTVHEWTNACFGIKRSISYSLLRIGKEETMEVLDDRGRVVDYTSKLRDVNGEDFTVTQLERMSNLDEGVRKDLVHDGFITADMTCKQIMDRVKQYKEAALYDQSDEMPELKAETFKVIIKGSRSKQQVLVEGLSEEEANDVRGKIAEMFGGVTENEEVE